MPRKDTFHDEAKNALIKDGWTITHDPYTILFGLDRLYIDIGAEPALAAEKDGRKIAVEIKSLLTRRDMPEFERALGQYFLYRNLLKYSDPERILFLAVTEEAYFTYFETLEGQRMIQDEHIKLVVFLTAGEVIERWIE